MQIGILRGKKIDYEGKDIVIAMIQSLITKVRDETGAKIARYPKHVMDYFGMMIIDEGHHISAKKVGNHTVLGLIRSHQFSTSFPLTGMRRTLLLTGTPYR